MITEPRQATVDQAPVVRGLPIPPPPLPGSQCPFPVRRTDPIGASDRMLGLCGWATVLGGTAPGWYQPTLAGVGLAGIGLTVAAFVVVRRDRLPWLLLGLATVPLLVNVGLTLAAL